MNNVFSHKVQRQVIVLIAVLATFFGLQSAGLSLGLFQIQSFVAISFLLYFFLVFWQTVIFDLKLRKPRGRDQKTLLNFWHALTSRFHYLKTKHHWVQFQNYLILPAMIYWSTVILLYLNPFDRFLKQVWIILATAALGTAFWYLKVIFYSHQEAKHIARQPVFLVKLYASFISFAATLGAAQYFGFSLVWIFVTMFCLAFLLLYQAFFQHHFIGFKIIRFLLAVSFFIAVTGVLAFLIWRINFYSGALAVSAIYNTFWGYIHHKYLDKDLTREILMEYLAILALIMVIVFSTTNFAQRI